MTGFSETMTGFPGRRTMMALLGGLALGWGTVAAAQDMADVEIDVIELNGPLAMLTGQGGNIGVSTGDDGVLMIDAQYEALADRIRDALDGENPRMLVNTHLHDDHTNGNPAFGANSVIVAHENVRDSLEEAGMPAVGLPVMTFSDRMTLHFNGERVDMIHYPRGHTDGDVVLYFSGSNVVHAGDLFFQGRFPFVDLDNGGSVQGYIANVDQILRQVDDDTQIIPGHGMLADKAELTRLRDMMTATVAEVRTMMADDMTLEAMVEEGLGEQWDEWAWNFITEERWIETIYNSYSESD
ncbi:MAG: MBL fold metallo-hydrolase [Pseudomonadota bacterium]